MTRLKLTKDPEIRFLQWHKRSLPKASKSYVLYHYSQPSCNESYICKTELTYTFVDTSISNCVKNKLQVQLTGKKDLINWDGLRRRITTVSLVIKWKPKYEYHKEHWK